MQGSRQCHTMYEQVQCSVIETRYSELKTADAFCITLLSWPCWPDLLWHWVKAKTFFWCILIQFGTLLFTQHTAVAGHAPAVARSEYRVSLNSTMVSDWNQIYLVCTVTLISAPFVGAGIPSRYITAVKARVLKTHCECIWPPEIAWQ